MEKLYICRDTRVWKGSTHAKTVKRDEVGKFGGRVCA